MPTSSKSNARTAAIACGPEREILTELEPYVLLAEGHPLAEASAIRPEDLALEPMVLLDAPPSRNYFLSIFQNVGLKPYIAFSSSSFEMVRSMVGHGLGFGYWRRSQQQR